jgi:hypothetical protein
MTLAVFPRPFTKLETSVPKTIRSFGELGWSLGDDAETASTWGVPATPAPPVRQLQLRRGCRTGFASGAVPLASEQYTASRIEQLDYARMGITPERRDDRQRRPSVLRRHKAKIRRLERWRSLVHHPSSCAEGSDLGLMRRADASVERAR